VPEVREQLVDARAGVLVDADDDVGQVGERVDAVGLAGGHQRVEAGQVLAGVVVPDEEEVLPVMQSTA